MIYVVLGALAVGLSLGLLGSGGSILTVPVLLYLLHHPGKAAIAESLAIVGVIALLAVLPYAREKAVDWKLAALFGLPGMAGTYAGAWLAGSVSGVVQLLVFAGVMLAASVFMWRKASRANVARAERPAEDTRRASIGLVVLQGAAVGVMTGFVGVGGGFLIVPALVLLANLPMRRAVATSLVIIAANSAIGFFKSWQVLDALDGAGGAIDWSTVGWFAVIGVVGSYAGRSLGGRINQAALQRVFAVFLLVMGAFIAVKQIVSLTG